MRYTWHARRRMAEMRLTEVEVERVVTNATLTRPSGPGARMATCSDVPGYAVVYAGETVITVVFRTHEPYVRDGVTYREVGPCLT